MQRRSFGLVPLGLVASVLMVIGTYGCDDSRKTAPTTAPAERKAIEVGVAPVQVEKVRRTVDVLGGLFGDEEVTISAKVTGRITRILKDVGDRASAGEPLAQTEKIDYELAVNQSRGALDQALAKLGLTELPDEKFDVKGVPTVRQAQLQSANAEARFRRSEKLFGQTPPLISEQDYTDSKTAFEVAQTAAQVETLAARALVAEARTRAAELRQQEQKLADATVRAPAPADVESSAVATTHAAAGRYGVSARLVSVGEYVSTGAGLFRLVADNPVKFRGSVPERYAGQVDVGRPITLDVEGQNEPWTGTVTRVNPQIERDNRSFQIEAVVPNADGKLRPGAFARARVGLSREEQATFVPESAVVSFAGISRVFDVKDGKAVARQVTAGVPEGGRVEISGKLNDLREVIVEGASQVSEGLLVVSKPSTRPVNTSKDGR